MQHIRLTAEAGTVKSEAKVDAKVLLVLHTASKHDASIVLDRTVEQPTSAPRVQQSIQHGLYCEVHFVAPWAGFRLHMSRHIMNLFRATLLSRHPVTDKYGVLCHTRCAMRLALPSPTVC